MIEIALDLHTNNEGLEFEMKNTVHLAPQKIRLQNSDGKYQRLNGGIFHIFATFFIYLIEEVSLYFKCANNFYHK